MQISSAVSRETTIMNEDKLFLLFVLSANQRAGTWFVAMRMSVDTSDWSAFTVCIQNSCLIWEDWPSVILPLNHTKLSNNVIFLNHLDQTTNAHFCL